MTDTRTITPLVTLRAVLAVSLVLAGLALVQFIQQAIQEQVWLVTSNRTAIAGVLGLLCLLLLAGLAIGFSPYAARLLAVLERAGQFTDKLPAFLRWLLAAFFMLALPILARGYYGRYLYNDFPRYLLLWLCALAVTALLGSRFKAIHAFLFAFLGISFLYYLSAFAYDISTYPLSLSWSEGSRYYFASTFFAQKVYGAPAPLPVTHPSRYLMQAVPFLLRSLPLWFHRLWQVLLTIGLTLWIATLLRKRLDLERGLPGVLFVLWASLFLLQGPIFYQMMIMVVVLLWGIDLERPWKTFILVVLTAAWAGITRINWVPMPAVLAAALYFMEKPLAGKSWQNALRYLLPTVLWFTAAMAAGLGVSSWYALQSGNAVELFSSSFTSDLLWYRLLPNPTYPLGILTGALLVSLPLLLYLALGLRRWRKEIEPLRLLCLAVILLVFYIGGLVVSVKIGGGTNLHNMDAFLLLLLMVAVYSYRGQLRPAKAFTPPSALFAVILLMPALFATSSGGVLPEWDFQAAGAVIEEIQHAADRAVDQGQDVLFISQRQLLTFGSVDVPFFPHYEKLLLMEMAMARNDTYLSMFEADLRAQRFGVIISDPLFDNIKRATLESLSEENDAWVQRVARPILCAYEIDYTDEGVQILVPIPGGWMCD